MPRPILIVTDAQPENLIELVDQQPGNRAVADISTQEAFGIAARDQHRATMLFATMVEKLWAETSTAKSLAKSRRR